MKPCSKCGEGKRMSYKSYCRQCHNAIQRRYRASRKELNKSIHQIGWRWWYNHWCN